MKATREYSENGKREKFGYTKVDFEITATMIQCMIQNMLEDNEHAITFANQKTGRKPNLKKINKTSIQMAIRDNLYERGTSWFNYGFWDNHSDCSTAISDKAKELANKFFPDFYTK